PGLPTSLARCKRADERYLHNRATLWQCHIRFGCGCTLVDIQVALLESLSPQRQLAIAADYLAAGAISPAAELGAYEWLWLNSADSYGAMADIFRRAPGLLPSEIVAADKVTQSAEAAIAALSRAGVTSFGIRVNQSLDYPSRLRARSNPAELLYFQG